MGSIPASIYSASGISAILECNPYKSKLLAWQEIMEKLKPGFNASKGYNLPEFPDNAPIRWGHGFESAGIKLAEEREGLNIKNREKLYRKEFGEILLTCHVDGEYEQSRPYVLHEFKTTWSRAFYSVKGEDCEETGEIEFKRRWGDPGSDCVPEEYQIQAAVQRICTGAELVKLSVLVFPKSTIEFEDLGWEVCSTEGFEEMTSDDPEKVGISGNFIIANTGQGKFTDPLNWARTFSDIGNFHTYSLPTNKKLESLIIEKVLEFDARYVKTELLPEFTDYQDVRRCMSSPMGTILATSEIMPDIIEYMYLKEILGTKSPHRKRQETLKVELMNWMNTHIKEDWSDPPEKIIIATPNGGKTLISYSEKGGFRAGKV